MGTITATDWIPSCDAASPCGPPLTGDQPEAMVTLFRWAYYPALVLLLTSAVVLGAAALWLGWCACRRGRAGAAPGVYAVAGLAALVGECAAFLLAMGASMALPRGGSVMPPLTAGMAFTALGCLGQALLGHAPGPRGYTAHMGTERKELL